MKIAIISGSHRPGSQSGKVARYLEGRVQELFEGCETYVLELGKTPLPLWDEGMWGVEAPDGYEYADWSKEWKPIAKELKSADALIVISAEWAGMVPAGLKNFFLMCSPKEVGHKPGMIVTVSASINGAYPVAELRSSSYKNCKLCYIPEHIIVRNAEQVLNDIPTAEEPFAEQDEYLRERIDFSLNILEEYAHALKQVRESGKTVNKKFPFGM